MNIETNDKLVRRNAFIGKATMIAGLVVLIGGMILSIRNPELFTLSLISLVVGFGLSQIGIYYGNRWTRRPRPDELLNSAMKGLDNKYSLYHYITPASHLLVGPAGLWVLIPLNQRGTITYEKGRWRQRGGGATMAYLKLFAQEGIGRPDLEIASQIESVERYLKKLTGEDSIPLVQAALVFTHDKTDIVIDEKDNPPAPSLPISKVKEFMRKTAKSKPISFEKVQQIQSLLSPDQQTASA